MKQFDLSTCKLVRTLKESSTATVQLMVTPKEQLVVAKTVYSQGDDAILSTARQIAEVVSRINSPLILETLGFVEDPQSFTTVHPYLKGWSLADHIGSRRKLRQFFTEKQLLWILNMTASALAILQLNRLAHRDVKPANILIGEDGNLKLADFGEACWNDESHVANIRTIRGSPFYLSPKLTEAYMAGALDSLRHDVFKSDVYSLGMTMLELVQLNRPNKYTNLSWVRSNLHIDISRLSYSDRFKDILSRMLNYEEETRPDCLQLLYLLSEEHPGGCAESFVKSLSDSQCGSPYLFAAALTAQEVHVNISIEANQVDIARLIESVHTKINPLSTKKVLAYMKVLIALKRDVHFLYASPELLCEYCRGAEPELTLTCCDCRVHRRCSSDFVCPRYSEYHTECENCHDIVPLKCRRCSAAPKILKDLCRV